MEHSNNNKRRTNEWHIEIARWFKNEKFWNVESEKNIVYIKKTACNIWKFVWRTDKGNEWCAYAASVQCASHSCTFAFRPEEQVAKPKSRYEDQTNLTSGSSSLHTFAFSHIRVLFVVFEKRNKNTFQINRLLFHSILFNLRHFILKNVHYLAVVWVFSVSLCFGCVCILFYHTQGIINDFCVCTDKPQKRTKCERLFSVHRTIECQSRKQFFEKRTHFQVV